MGKRGEERGEGESRKDGGDERQGGERKIYAAKQADDTSTLGQRKTNQVYVQGSIHSSMTVDATRKARRAL